MNINQKLESLEKSKFRSKFYLTEKEKEYIKEKGMDTIKKHAEDFILKRLAPYPTPNDGSQTPWKGHPVFVAQHGTATCCRGCLEKWYHIPKNRCLTKKEQEDIVEIIVRWIEKKSKL